jgi:hypothetical protein
VTVLPSQAMKPVHKAALIVVGYAICFLIAFAAVALRVATTSGSARQAASGMYGFGDTILFVGVFGVFALVPTGAALFFLRPNRTFWKVLSALGLALAVTGVAAAIIFAVGRGESTTRLAIWAGYSVLMILLSPFLALAFIVCAAFSPQRTPRIALAIAAMMEIAVFLSWFVAQFLHR